MLITSHLAYPISVFRQCLPQPNKSESLLATNNALFWHKKLGHLSYTNMEKLILLSEGMNLTPKLIKTLEICDIFIKAKQTAGNCQFGRTYSHVCMYVGRNMVFYNISW